MEGLRGAGNAGPLKRWYPVELDIGTLRRATTSTLGHWTLVDVAITATVNTLGSSDAMKENFGGKRNQIHRQKL
jgi:hypothetical protein